MITVLALEVAFLCAVAQLGLTASVPKKRWEEPEHWLRRNNNPNYPRWWWKKTPPTLPRTTKATPTTKRPGPEICQSMTIVSRIQDGKGPVVCVRKNVTELMQELNGVGGFIKRYMGVKVIDACGFEDLAAINNPIVTRPPTRNSSLQSDSRETESQPEQLFSNTELQRRKRTLPTSPGTIYRGCQGRGTIIDGTDEHRLCTECAATTHLGNDRFPTYINEVVCHDSDKQCAAKMGMCIQRSLKFQFLRSTRMFRFDAFESASTGKTIYKEVWEQYTQEIRSCCQCGMDSAIFNKIASGDDDD